MDVDQILANLFVGSCPRDPADIDSLATKSGITAVLNVQTDDISLTGISVGTRWKQCTGGPVSRFVGCRCKISTPRNFGGNFRPVCKPRTDCCGPGTPCMCIAVPDEPLAEHGSGLPSLGSGMPLNKRWSTYEPTSFRPYVDAIRLAMADRGGEAECPGQLNLCWRELIPL